MAYNFTVLSITYTITPQGLIIVLVTDVPVHLWIRWTLLEPWIHPIPRQRRGIWIYDDVRFCFDVYTDVEQLEPGDTLIHTFLLPPWAVDTPLWLYSWGEMDLHDSPSTTAIHKTVSPAVWPPPTPLVRYALRRRFTRSGSLFYLYVNYGLAATFAHGPDVTFNHEAYLFTKNNPDLEIRVAIYYADLDDKPTGSELVGQTLNLNDGVIDGGDGGANMVYRHTASLSALLLPNLHYCLVTICTGAAAELWINLRSRGWLGPTDPGIVNMITGWRTYDAGLTWVAVGYGLYANEIYGYQHPL